MTARRIVPGAWLLGLALLPLLGSPAAAAAPAPNLLFNPDFDTGLFDWQQFGEATVTWDGTNDADGSPSSGSAKAVWQMPAETGLVPVLSQCVAVTPGTTYLFGGKAMVPAGQTVSGTAFFIALPFLGPACSGPPPPSAFVETPPVEAGSGWTETIRAITPFGPSVMISAYLAPQTGGTFQASYDDLFLRLAACVPDAQTLCLLGGRFEVTATFDAGGGNSGSAHAMGAGDSGLLWFFNASNIEAVVKVIDGCVVNGSFWFFAGGLTNVGVTITVTDTETGAVKTYTNPRGTPFAPVQDTSAFSCSLF